MDKDHDVENLQHSSINVTTATGSALTTTGTETLLIPSSVVVRNATLSLTESIPKSSTTSPKQKSKSKSQMSLLEHNLLCTKRGSIDSIIPTRLANAKVALATHINQDQEQLLTDHYIIQDHDVLCCERGMKDTNDQHTGNQQFVTFIETHWKEYHTTTSRYHRIQIVRRIVDSVRQLGGKFVRHDTSRKVWYDIGNMKAREKVSHSLRAMIAKQYGTSSRPEKSLRKKRKRTKGHHNATQLTMNSTNGQSSTAIHDPGSFDPKPSGNDYDNTTEKSTTVVSSSETELSNPTMHQQGATAFAIDRQQQQQQQQHPTTIKQQLQEQLDLQIMLQQTLQEQQMIRIRLENEVKRSLYDRPSENYTNPHGPFLPYSTIESESVSSFPTSHVSSCSDTNHTLRPNSNLSVFGSRVPEDNNVGRSPMHDIICIAEQHNVPAQSNLEWIQLSHSIEPDPILLWPTNEGMNIGLRNNSLDEQSNTFG
jgi:hypothetical protein